MKLLLLSNLKDWQKGRPREHNARRIASSLPQAKNPCANSAKDTEPTQTFENAIGKFSEQGDALADAIKTIQKGHQEQAKQFSEFMGMMENFMQAIQTQFTAPGSNQHTD